MIMMPDPGRLSISSLTEIFLFNRSDQAIRIEGDGIGSSLTLWPGQWGSREVHRGTSVIIATWVLSRYSFDIGIDELGRGPVERCKLVIPSEVGSSLRWAWDGLTWHHLSGEGIHDFEGGFRRQHRPIWS
jgi:hypothetical protein